MSDEYICIPHHQANCSEDECLVAQDKIDAVFRALVKMTTCGHVAEVAGDLIPNAVRDRKNLEGWAPCECLGAALKITCGNTDKDESSDSPKI